MQTHPQSHPSPSLSLSLPSNKKIFLCQSLSSGKDMGTAANYLGSLSFLSDTQLLSFTHMLLFLALSPHTLNLLSPTHMPVTTTKSQLHNIPVITNTWTQASAALPCFKSSWAPSNLHILGLCDICGLCQGKK